MFQILYLQPEGKCCSRFFYLLPNIHLSPPERSMSNHIFPLVLSIPPVWGSANCRPRWLELDHPRDRNLRNLFCHQHYYSACMKMHHRSICNLTKYTLPLSLISKQDSQTEHNLAASTALSRPMRYNRRIPQELLLRH